jgi:ribose transport system substrate-binding protein
MVTTAVVAAASLALVLAGASASAGTRPGSQRSHAAKHLNVAFFAASSENSFNDATWQGIQEEAKQLGGVSVHIFDGKFDASTQFNEVESAGASHQYNGGVILAQDNVGVAPAVKYAINSGMKMVAAWFPIGANLATLAPQVPGLTATVAQEPAHGAALQADQVVQFCKNKPSCSVVIIVGDLSTPFDKTIYDTYQSILKAHSNISIVATGQGEYSESTSLSVMANILQAHPHFDVLLSDADQQVEGAQVALKNAGWNLKSLVGSGKLYLMGAGADTAAVKAMRAGTWSASLANYPVTFGQLSLEQLVKALRGQPYQKIINVDNLPKIPAIVTSAVLKRNPGFTGQWSG